MNRLTFRPSRAVASVSDWMRKTIAANVEITAAHVSAWAAAIDTAERRHRELEETMVSRRVDLNDRIDATYAALLAEQGADAVRELAAMAREAATSKELLVIDAAEKGLISALEALAAGLVRRAQTTEQTGA